MDELQQINIDLNALKSGKIDEFSYLTSLGKQIEIMMPGYNHSSKND